METFFGALGTVVAVYLLLRAERTELRAEISALRTELHAEITALRTELRTEMREGFAAVNARIDHLVGEFARHVHEGHPPHQAA